MVDLDEVVEEFEESVEIGDVEQEVNEEGEVAELIEKLVKAAEVFILPIELVFEMATGDAEEDEDELRETDCKYDGCIEGGPITETAVVSLLCLRYDDVANNKLDELLGD